MNLFLKVVVFIKLATKKVIYEPKTFLSPRVCFRKLIKYFRFTSYKAWLNKYTLDKSQIQNLKTSSNSFNYKPTISAIYLTTFGNKHTVDILNTQVYPCHEIVAISKADELLGAIKRSTGEYIIFIKEGDILYPNTVYELVNSLNNEENMLAELVFSDHDYYKGKKRIEPFFKPGWSLDLFIVKNYLKRAILIKRGPILAQSEIVFSSNYEANIYTLCLKIAHNGRVIHCPGILFSFPSLNLADSEIAEMEVRLNILNRNQIQISMNKYSVPSVIRHLGLNSKISIIIPTCFKEDFIISCLQSIVSRTSYPNYEIIVLDNSRKDKSFSKEKLKDYDCKIVYIDLPFNWSQFNNIGVSYSTGEIYLFLNDDTEVINNDWLELLASNAIRPDIGAVGALLLFPNGSVQHAGIYLVDHGGGARHCFFNLPENYKGYHNLLHYQRNVIGVTGACQMISKEKFHEMGGFDETFGVVSNDVDLCLRLWVRGYHNLYLPEVKLIHKEKASRGNMSEEKDNSKFWERWGHLLICGDPYYNKYLSLENSDFRIRMK